MWMSRRRTRPAGRGMPALALLPLLLLPPCLSLLPRGATPAAFAAELPLDPALHRATLQANADRAATLDQATRNPRRFRGTFARFEGRVEAIAEEGGERRSATRLLVVNGPLSFSCRVRGDSSRIERGARIEAYGRLRGTENLFGTGRIPHMEAVRVLTQDDIARDDRTLRDLNIVTAARGAKGGLLAAGRKLLAEGRYGDAYLTFELGGRTDRSASDEVWLYEMARALYPLGRLDEARTLLERAMRDVRHAPAVRLLLGRILLDLGDPVSAARHLRRADELARDAETLRHLARAEARLGEALDALRHYDLALRLAPEDPDLLFSRAEVAAKTGHLESALRDLDRFLELRPDDFAGERLRADCMRRLSLHRAAERGAAEAERDDALAAATEALGEAFDPVDQAPLPEDLLPRLERAAARHPDRHRLHNHLGLAAMRAGRADEAVARFRRAVELAPRIAVLRWNLGHALLRMSDLQGALEEFAAASRLDPRMERATRRGESCARALDFEIRREFRATGPERALFYRELGDREMSRGRLDEALFAWTEAARHDPLETRALYKIGRALHERGRDGEARARFREALRRAPGAAEGIRELSRLGYEPREIRALGGRVR